MCGEMKILLDMLQGFVVSYVHQNSGGLGMSEKFQNWKEKEMVYNRLNVIRKHKELMEILNQDALDLEDIRHVLKVLVLEVIPVSELELKVYDEC
jgi:septum formation inhibitor-activating ATPase MinD